MSRPLRVLLLEDRPADAELAARELRRAGFEPDWQRVGTEADYLARLDPALDLVLVDYSLPQLDAPRALALLKERGLDVPVIVLSGSVGEDVVVECMKLGAADYLLKDRLARLGPAVERALREARLRVEKRRAEAALRESEERFRSAFDGAATGMALQGTDGRYLRVNQALCDMIGYTPDDLLARTFDTVIHPDDRDTDRDHDRRMLAGEIGAYQIEKRYMHRRGHVVWVLASVTLVRSRDGRPLYFLVQAQDVTERRRAEDAQARLQAQLTQTEKLAAMGQLLAGVAHELNNPLSVVLGQSTLLVHAARSGPLERRAGKIVAAAERCARIVKNFLALARQRPTERQPVDLNRVAEGAVELLAYSLRLDNVEVGLDLAPDLPTTWADPDQLHQVVVNLVTNAHHAMRGTTGPRRLRLGTRFDHERQRVRLEVADTGPGIPPEILARIFEPFFTTKPQGQGTGLGLSLCQGIVEGHGGAIHVENTSGHGAVFRVELPATSADRPGVEPASGAGPAHVSGKAILVVDDEPEVAAVLADFLEDDGHRVDLASDGRRALAMLDQRPYDLILSDMRMPELDGPGLYREVERRYPALSRRFIFLTGDGLGLETRQFLDGGGPTVSKPFRPDEVRAVVQEALAREASR